MPHAIHSSFKKYKDLFLKYTTNNLSLIIRTVMKLPTSDYFDFIF